VRIVLTLRGEIEETSQKYRGRRARALPVEPFYGLKE